MMQMSAAFFPTRLKMATCNIIFYLTENYPDAQAKVPKNRGQLHNYDEGCETYNTMFNSQKYLLTRQKTQMQTLPCTMAATTTAIRHSMWLLLE